MYIYVLLLEEDHVYVGRTNNPNARLDEHFQGGGAAWTKRFPPTEVIECVEGDIYDEDKYVKKYMALFGIEKVCRARVCLHSDKLLGLQCFPFL